MTTLRDAAGAALKALEEYQSKGAPFISCDAAVNALRTALAQPEQEPVAEVKLMMTGGNAGLATRIVEIEDHLRERLRPGQMLYTAPLQRKPLTKDEIRDGARRTDPGGEDLCHWSFERGVRFAEIAHGIKGGA